MPQGQLCTTGITKNFCLLEILQLFKPNTYPLFGNMPLALPTT
jgi:hypothetical protein